MKEKSIIRFEQYKMLVDSAEKTSDKRITQNNIYLTINLAFLSFVMTKNLTSLLMLFTCSIGIAICLVWFFTISNYSKRNKVKFDIINEMENEFGYLYSEEWKRISILTSLSVYERIISCIFILTYSILFVINIL